MNESAEWNSRSYILIPYPEFAKVALAWDDGGRGGLSIAVVSPALGGTLACAGRSVAPEGGSVAPEGGGVTLEWGGVAPEGGDVVPTGGASGFELSMQGIEKLG